MASALRWPVGEVEDTRAKSLRVHKLQLLLIAPFLKEALPAAQDNGMDHEPKLVEEVVLKQRPDEGAAADDRDVLARLLLELGDLFRDISLDQGRVLPLEGLLQGRRDDELGGVVHVVRKLLVVTTLRRPESSEFFVGHSSEEHGVRFGHRRPDRLSHLVVEVWKVPPLRRFHDAVQRHQLRCDYFPHGDLLYVRRIAHRLVAAYGKSSRNQPMI